VEGDEGGIKLRQAVVGPYVGYGWAPSSPSRPGLYAALAVPVFFPLAQLDGYLQVPPAWTGGLSAGIGAVASAEGVAPYVQLGMQPDRGVGWYVSAAYGVRESSSTIQSTSAAWMGTAALSISSGWVRSHVFVQAANGRIPGPCNEETPGARSCTRGEQASALAVGISVGRQSRNVR
jgi:hypothetical protein